MLLLPLLRLLCFVYHQCFIKKIFSQNWWFFLDVIHVWRFTLPDSRCFFILFIFFTHYEIWSSRWVKSQKNWWALYDKWKLYIDTSLFVLCNELRFGKMKKRFLKVWVSEHVFYKFFRLTHINQHSFVKARNNFQSFMMTLSFTKLKRHFQVWDNFGIWKTYKNDTECLLFRIWSSFRS